MPPFFCLLTLRRRDFVPNRTQKSAPTPENLSLRAVVTRPVTSHNSAVTGGPIVKRFPTPLQERTHECHISKVGRRIVGAARERGGCYYGVSSRSTRIADFTSLRGTRSGTA